MLVLSRRCGENILLPELDVRFEVVNLAGNTARIGVAAPKWVTILRGELAHSDHQNEVRDAAAAEARHAHRNHLNKLQLMLALARKQQEKGMTSEAEATFAQALSILRGAAQPESTPVEGKRRMRVLVVDDDRNERELLAGVLMMHGCECETAADGEAALMKINRPESPDIVLLDMRMPRCDGPQLLAQVRRDHRWAGLKIFATSGSTPEEVGVQTGPGGVNAWFTKPLNPQQLWQAIQQHIAPSEN